ncbi:MAG: hypothetical protein WC822_07000 [Candidatus Paceibacterota bacterium]|jgi:hypothetical protein
MTKRSGPPPAASSKVLRIRTDDQSGLSALEQAERQQDQADESALEQRIAGERASDKIGSVVGYGPFVLDQSPTEVFGPELIAACKNDVSKIPNWRFSRWYFRDRIIVDLFRVESAYKEADVPARRRMAKKYGIKYAALGPRMSYRTDLPQQLGI